MRAHSDDRRRGAAPDAPPCTARDDETLAKRIRSGEREALGELYDRYASAAFATAVRIVADREVAEDLVHEAFVAVWHKIDRFDTRRGMLRSWLLTIVRNRAIDRVRARRPSMAVGDAELGTSADPTSEAAMARLSAADLQAALDTLPHEQRRAIELAYFEGYTYHEIAEITGVPYGTASGRLRLGLARLREGLRTPDAGTT